jgi:hypothetical protein
MTFGESRKGRPPLGARAMTPAERQARRAARMKTKAAQAVPDIHVRLVHIKMDPIRTGLFLGRHLEEAHAIGFANAVIKGAKR